LSAYSGGGTLASTYYSNDLVASQTQGGITNTYQLDGALRQRLRTQTGGSEPGTEVYHYARRLGLPSLDRPWHELVAKHRRHRRRPRRNPGQRQRDDAPADQPARRHRRDGERQSRSDETTRQLRIR
jgi:hypothetical protein